MIVMRNLTKSFLIPGGCHYVLKNVNITIPSRTSVALLGRNGSGKSTLLKIIGRMVLPSQGRVMTSGSVSWAVGLTGGLHTDMTGAQNTRFVARIYGVDTESLVDFVREFSELGSYFNLPVRLYSTGMRSRLSFGISLGIPFDTYLVDEVTSVGDANFKEKSRSILSERIKNSGAIVVSHSVNELRNMCRSGMILDGDNISFFWEIEEAILYYDEMLKNGTK